jgi:hypothetical protein
MSLAGPEAGLDVYHDRLEYIERRSTHYQPD